MDYEGSVRTIKELLDTGSNVTDGMQVLLSFCMANTRSKLWKPLEQLDYTADVCSLDIWLEEVLKTTPPPSNIKAFWFGLFNPIKDDGQPTSGLYVSGSTTFDPKGYSIELAVWSDDSYLPEGRYAQSAVLDAIYTSTAASKIAQFAEYTLCWGYACLVVNLLRKKINRRLLNGNMKARGIAAGFDSGDYLIVQQMQR
jgi:hypothetical protein